MAEKNCILCYSHMFFEEDIMLNKATEKSFKEKFRNPDKEYRAAPFWSWNDKLDNDLLKKQIGYFKEMGFGGFYMHPRGGMETQYMSEEYIAAIECCIKAAEQNEMYACLYDEDRWPSGFAGGLVTKTAKYRQRAIYITDDEKKVPTLCHSREKALQEGKAYLVGCYDVCLNEKGYLKSYRCITRDEEAEFTKYFAYSKTDELSGRYNNQTYTDIMQKDAIKEFISVTHNVFYKKFGDKYGKTVPNIFSDEPRHRPLELINIADENEIVYYWTYDFPETFEEEYGYNIVERLPKIVWDEEDTHSYERYDFFEHITRRTEEAFFIQIKEALEKQGLEYSGHLMLENELYGQLRWGGDIMRYYPHFDIPGIDVLFDNIEFIGAKQVQSIVHQYGKKAMLSELYGVTGWDFDFKCLKMQGDWQAALGVSVRVPHLAMYSMKGAAKRDYPASFNYQSPWFKEFKNIEDHFARINTVFENSKPIVDVAVLHPIETVMLAVNKNNADYICKLEDKFNDIVNSLLYSNIDFDFINEANLCTQDVKCTNKLCIGDMSYSVVIVPPVKTMRKNTVEIFNQLIDNGVPVIFIGECPQYVDGKKNYEVKKLYERAKISSSDKLIAELEKYRHIKISYVDKSKCNKIIYRFADKDDAKWLFIARAEKTGKSSKERSSVRAEKVVISIKGEYQTEIYDTLSGEIRRADYLNIDGTTYINYDLYANDSLLLKLSGQKHESEEKKIDKPAYKTIIPEKVTYKKDEDNCIVLDMGSYSVDGSKYSDKMYFKRINDEACDVLNIVQTDAQPYTEMNPVKKSVYIKYEFYCEDVIDGLKLALENAEETEIYFNGQQIENKILSYFVDESIKTIGLPQSEKGKNIIELKVQFSKIRTLEPCYVLGDFDSSVNSDRIYIKKRSSDEIEFTSITKQGMSFYGGNILYKTRFYTEECRAEITVDKFVAPCIRVFVDGKDSGLIAFSPFNVYAELSEGEHELEFVCYGNRNNTFGPIHNIKIEDPNYYIMPSAWDYKSELYTDNYCFQEVGIVGAPQIRLYEK